jgi:hypothetical protein
MRSPSANTRVAMSTVPLNALTAWPMLRLMLAMQGMEPPTLPAGRTWTVFKAFLQLPSASERDVSSFQTTWIREDPDTPTFAVRWVRHLTDSEPGGEPLTRSVEAQFLYESPYAPGLAEHTVWSDDFSSLEEFVAAVEALPEWRFAVENDRGDGELLEDEESADGVA